MRYVILKDCIAIFGQAQSFPKRLLDQPAGTFVNGRGRGFDPAAGICILVMINDEPALIPPTIRIRKHILVHRAAVPEEIIEQELFNASKQVAVMQERKEPPFVAPDETFICRLLPFGAAELHAIFFMEAFDLSVAKHGQPR